MQFSVSAIRTNKGSGNGALVRQPAALAKWRLKELYVVPAAGTKKTILGCRTGVSASLAEFGVGEGKSGVDPALQILSQNAHVAHREAAEGEKRKAVFGLDLPTFILGEACFNV
jgi:hypothetical protein